MPAWPAPSTPTDDTWHDPARQRTRPVLSITGTRDGDVVNTGATPDRRIAVFGALPPGRKAELMLQDADPMTFAGQPRQATEIVPRSEATHQLQPRHHALVAEITTDLWRAHLSNDDASRNRLKRPDGLGPRDVWAQG